MQACVKAGVFFRLVWARAQPCAKIFIDMHAFTFHTFFLDMHAFWTFVGTLVYTHICEGDDGGDFTSKCRDVQDRIAELLHGHK